MAKRKIEDGLEPLGYEVGQSAALAFAVKVSVLAAAGLAVGLFIIVMV